MAYDERYSGPRPHGRNRRRDEPTRDWRDDARGGWREEERSWGDEIRGWFGGRRHERDDDDGRYGRSGFESYGGRDDFGRHDGSDIRYGGPSFDDSFGQPRFDQVDVGRSGSHGVQSLAGGANYGFGPGYRGAARDHAIRERDPHYSEWRRRQIAALDRDYDDYRRENQSRFDNEFGAWRTRRGAQREAVGQVTEHMEVVGSDDGHVGTVDKVCGDGLILTKSDAAAGGVHHRILCGWVDRVDDKVRLNLTAEQATERWRTEGRSRALFEREDSGSDGPHILNRSFSGTYRNE